MLEGRYPGDAHPNALLGGVVSICVDWGIPIFFSSDRQAAKLFVEDYLERCWRAINERDLG